MQGIIKFQGNLPLDIFIMGCPCKHSFIEDDFIEEINELKKIALEKGIEKIDTEEIIEALAFIKKEGFVNGDLEYWMKNKNSMIKKSELIKKEMKTENKFKIVKCLFEARGDAALSIKLLYKEINC